MKTQVLLIRHGEPQLKQALLGTTDSPLSTTGFSQLEMTFQTLKDLDLVVSSPLSRCADFAKFYCDQHRIECRFDPAWRECDFGEWDGLTYETLHSNYPQSIENFYRAPAEHTPPGGEPLLTFSRRVEKALYDVVQPSHHSRIVILCHAGVIRTLVAWCLNMDYSTGAQFHRLSVDYASITELSIFKDEHHQLHPVLVNLNRTEHLEYVG